VGRARHQRKSSSSGGVRPARIVRVAADGMPSKPHTSPPRALRTVSAPSVASAAGSGRPLTTRKNT
jgi:hypothetical protein